MATDAVVRVVGVGGRALGEIVGAGAGTVQERICSDLTDYHWPVSLSLYHVSLLFKSSCMQ